MNQGEFLTLAIGVVVLLGNAVTAWAVLTGKSGMRTIQQPLRVQHEKDVLTKAEHVEHCGYMERRVVALEARTERIERTMQSDKTEIIDAGEERAINIHNRINDIDKKVSALDERTGTTNSTLAVQSAKIDRILERLKA